MSGGGGKLPVTDVTPTSSATESADEIELRRKLEGVLQPIVKPDADPGEVESRVEQLELIAESYYRGPLPPPSVVAHYERLLPGAANRILSLTEEDQRHDQWLDREYMSSQRAHRMRGQYLGFSIMLSLIGVAAYCIVRGNEIGAGLFLVPAALAVGVSFLAGQLRGLGRHPDEDDDDDELIGAHSIADSELANSAEARVRDSSPPPPPPDDYE